MEKNKALVRRITVDEKLADDLIRLLVSALAEGAKEFYEGEEDWEDEKECLIQPETYYKEMSIPPQEKGKWLWIDLQEGQVFLSGQFKALPNDESPEKFSVSPGKIKFLRIDKLIKRDIKNLYFKVLKRRIQDANSH